MIYKLSFLVLASVSICFAEPFEGDEKVDVALYYEVLCPGCIQFYSRILLPLDEKIGKSLEIRTYPFGNAMFEDDAHTKVRCQHGEKECYGNKLHACAIKHLGQQEKYVEYNACTISKRSTDEAADECGKQLGVDSSAVKKCAKGSEGEKLLRFYGEETLKVRPGQNYTPYFVIKGKPYEGSDFFKAVCAAFKNPPAPCKAMIPAHRHLSLMHGGRRHEMDAFPRQGSTWKY